MSAPAILLGMQHLIPMSHKELRSFTIVQNVLGKRLTTTEAAEQAAVTSRTLRRWKAKVRRDGATALVHGNRGQPSPGRVPVPERQRIVNLITTRYPDFAPTAASEQLEQDHGIDHHPSTIREIMIEAQLWIPRAQRPRHRGIVHRRWRERKAHRGELVQFDGSYHHWFEGRGALGEVCLLAAIDDATGQLLHAQFVPHEGVLPVMGFWQAYISIYGLPKALYLDRFSTYKMHLTIAKDNPDLKTQLQRAMDTLGTEPIFARSPQAKGRVERLFRTLQDRLVKAMRLKGIVTVETGNRFLQRTFIPAFNKKFSVLPREQHDFHRILSKRELAELPDVLCRQETRSVQYDFTISFRSQWYQILPTRGLAIRPRDAVLVREYPDATIAFFIRHRRLDVQPIAKVSSARLHQLRLIPTLVPKPLTRTYS